MSKDEPLYYIGSKGRQLAEDVHLAHFANALRKVERMGPSDPNYENLDALKAVFERRQAEWDAEHPEEARAAGR